MDCKEELQEEMKTNHQFLWELYVEKAHTIRRRLLKATNSELCILIKIVYCIEQGYIPIKKVNFERLVQRRRMKPILGLKYKIKKLLRSPLEEKRKWATQLSSQYKYLLYSLFEKEKPKSK